MSWKRYLKWVSFAIIPLLFANTSIKSKLIDTNLYLVKDDFQSQNQLTIATNQLAKIIVNQIEFDSNSLIANPTTVLNKELIGSKITPKLKFSDQFSNAIEMVSKLNQEFDQLANKDKTFFQFALDLLEKQEESKFDFEPKDERIDAIFFLSNLININPKQEKTLNFIRILPNLIKSIFKDTTITINIKIGGKNKVITFIENGSNVFLLSDVENFLNADQTGINFYEIEFLTFDFIVVNKTGWTLKNQSVDSFFKSVKNLPSIQKTKNGFQYSLKFRSEYNEHHILKDHFLIPIVTNQKNFSVNDIEKNGLNSYQREQITYAIKNSFTSQKENNLNISSATIKYIKDPEKLIKKSLIKPSVKNGIFYVWAQIINSNDLTKWGSKNDSEIIKDKMYFLEQNKNFPAIRTYLFQMRTKKLVLNVNDIWFKSSGDKLRVIVNNVEIDEFNPKENNTSFFESYEVHINDYFSLANKELLIKKLNLALSEMNLLIDKKKSSLDLFPKEIKLTTLKINSSLHFYLNVDAIKNQLNIEVNISKNRLTSLVYDIAIKNENELQIRTTNNYLNKYIWFDLDKKNNQKLKNELKLFLSLKKFQFKKEPNFSLKKNSYSFQIDKIIQSNSEDKKTDIIVYLIIGFSVLVLFTTVFIYFHKWNKKQKMIKNKTRDNF
ncbi:hypothetical protein [Mycoplasmoides genitalium]